MSSDATELDAPAEANEGQATSSPPPAEPTSAEPVATVPESQFKELQRGMSAKGEELASYKDMVAIWQQNPGWGLAEMQTYVKTGEAPSAVAETSKSDEILGRFEDQGTQDVLRAYGEALREELREERQRELAPLGNRIQQTQSEVASERAALGEGLTLPELRSSEYADFVAEYEGDRPYLASARRSHPEAVSTEIARAFKESRQGFEKERKRLQDAKDASLASTSSSGTVTDQAKNGTVKVKRGSTSMLKIQKLLAEGKQVEWT